MDRLVLNGLMIEDRKKDTILYAGEAKVNLTDWFFFKDKIVLKNVQLNDAIVNMNRVDSTWNYQFVLDYFAGGPKDSTKKTKGPEIDLKELHFSNIQFNKIDGWVGQNLIASLKKMDLVMDSVNMPGKSIAVKDIYLEQPKFWQSDYKGNKPIDTNLVTILNQIPVVSAFKWNKSGWVVRLGKLQIFDGEFRNDKAGDRTMFADRFDGQHIIFNKINGNFNNLLFLNDTLRTNIKLSAKERSGLNLTKLESDLKFTPELMEFNNLTLQTDKSKLGPYYSMSYKAFRDMNNFLSDVTLEARFRESTLSTDDLAIFAPNLRSMKRVFHIDGNAKGTVENFTANNLKIRTGSSYLDGDLRMSGLPNINTTFIDLRSRMFQTNYNELSSIAPALKRVTTPNLRQLGTISYRGTYTGFINDFVAYGDLNTNLGNLRADMNMKLPSKGTPSYSGKISTAGFQLGRFINDPKFGNVALNGTIKGKGFSVNELDANFKGTISQLYYSGYNYRNAVVDGTLKNKIFDGNLSINDPNLQIRRLDGRFSFANKTLAFNADADIERIDLRKLNISKENLVLQGGNFKLNFTGNTIDDFLGEAEVYNARLIHNDKNLSFDFLRLRSYIEDSTKHLSLETNELQAMVTGRFRILELPDAFTSFLSKYYPAYIKAPNKRIANQDFKFDIKTQNIDEYLGLFVKNMSGFNNADISGSVKLETSELNITANVPEFTYAGKTFSGIKLNGRGTGDTLYTDVYADNIRINDSLQFPETYLNIKAHNDISLVKLVTRASKTLNAAELNASVQTFSDGVSVHFFPSTFVLNNKKWELEKDGELTVRKNYPINASEIKFVNGEQQIVISSELEEETNNVNLTAGLQSVIIEDILPLFLSKPALAGTVTGKAIVKDPFGKPFIDFRGKTDSLTMDGTYLGVVNFNKVTFDSKTGIARFDVNSDNEDFKVKIDGFFNSKDSTGNKMAINLKGDRVPLSALNPYLSTVFSELDGFAKADAVIKHNGLRPYLLGEVTVDSGSVTVAYTKVKYLLENETIKFNPTDIDLGILRLKDTLGNIGTASGRIEHEFFNDFYFRNMRFETAKLLLLNTKKTDNLQFYGNVIGRALMTMNGRTTNLEMNITGEPSSVDSSQIYLPTGAEAREGTKVDYIEFIQFGSEMDSERGANKNANIFVNLNLRANPACKVDVILDEETGDVIKAQGNGNLNISVGTTQPLSIRGRYELTGGQYTFNFQTYLKRFFTLLPGGSITWNGDPYLALIDIKAQYRAENVDISSITATSGVRRKEDIDVLAYLTGNLTKPEIKFEFKFMEGSEASRDYFAVKKLEDFKNDENAMFKQVASLLLLNSFVSDNEAFLSGQGTLNIGVSTVGGIVSTWLTNVFNKELERATKGVISTYIDINPTLDLQNRANQLQANIRAGLKIQMSDRIVARISGNLEYNNPYIINPNQRSLFSPDYSIEWLLNKDGSLRVVGFSRRSIDFTSIQRNRSGVQLAYRKEFDQIGDIFKSRKKIAARDSMRMNIKVNETSVNSPGQSSFTN